MLCRILFIVSECRYPDPECQPFSHTLDKVQKHLPVTDALAYFAAASVTQKRSFDTDAKDVGGPGAVHVADGDAAPSRG
jgi:hypothetical protein